MVEHYQLTEVPLDLELCTRAALLPLHHRDPCDRFIIAAAKRLQVPVVTMDRKFEAYGVEVIS
ncbi:MAG: PIN domain-containing protein [Chthoniobacteraceae bacterium]